MTTMYSKSYGVYVISNSIPYFTKRAFLGYGPISLGCISSYLSCSEWHFLQSKTRA